MIRREESDSIWVIHQATHAYVAGQIAEHWVGDGNMQVQPRDELIVAAYYHDTGWAATERQPRVNAQGKPRTFTEMDLEEHFTIWQDSIYGVFAQNRYAGLLVSMHCSALYDQRLRYIDDPPDDKARVKAFLGARRDWERALIATLTDHPRYGLAVQSATLAHNLRLLQVWDYLSLLLCMGPVYEQVLEDVPFNEDQRDVLYVAARGTRGLLLEPYPLDQPLTVWMDARQVVGGPFESDDALQHALCDVPYKPLVFEVGPI